MNLKTIKVRVENEKSKEKYLYIILPINEDELLDLTSDVIGRYKDGILIDGGYCIYNTITGETIEDIYELNDDLIKLNNIEMPEYKFGENPNVLKQDGTIYEGSHKTRLLPLLDEEKKIHDDFLFSDDDFDF